MYKIILSILVVGVIFLESCKSEKEDSKEVLETIDESIAVKDSTFEVFIHTFNEIQDNLDSIKAVENIIAEKSKNRDVRDVKQDIQNDIAAIKNFMVANKKKMLSLNNMLQKDDQKLKESEQLMRDMQKLYERTNNELELRDMELQDMGDYLSKLKVKLNLVSEQLEIEKSENKAKTLELNTAYLIIGTSKELKKAGIITKAGLLGIAKNSKLNSDFNKSKFKKVNILEQTHIAIKARSAKLITSHPSKSYKISSTSKYVDALEIKSPKEFWGASKYLVILIEN